MGALKFFFIIVFLILVITAAWYFVLYRPIQMEEEKVKAQIETITEKLKDAQFAQRDLRAIDQRLAESKTELEEIKAHIVDRDNLAQVMERLQQVSEKFDLEFEDFSPVLESYFQAAGNNRIKPIPIVVTVKGRYLNIGKFIEYWQKLDFYLKEQEAIIEKLNPKSNELTANITCILYTWNK
ncbi:hypothetical protein B1H10_02030 [candidate division KSB1 bacterium 4484_188]|nr:MAG: hypothetical protein B1H10_02030 [candidate division KSB1 bacterium 4484_188]HFE63208.1 hypothetical protein [Caldithrix sp.]